MSKGGHFPKIYNNSLEVMGSNTTEQSMSEGKCC